MVETNVEDFIIEAYIVTAVSDIYGETIRRQMADTGEATTEGFASTIRRLSRPYTDPFGFLDINNTGRKTFNPDQITRIKVGIQDNIDGFLGSLERKILMVKIRGMILDKPE